MGVNRFFSEYVSRLSLEAFFTRVQRAIMDDGLGCVDGRLSLFMDLGLPPCLDDSESGVDGG